MRLWRRRKPRQCRSCTITAADSPYSLELSPGMFMMPGGTAPSAAAPSKHTGWNAFRDRTGVVYCAPTTHDVRAARGPYVFASSAS